MKEVGKSKFVLPEVSQADDLKHKIETDYKKEMDAAFAKKS